MTVSPIDLVTLADARGWLDIPAGSDDVNVQRAITAVSQMIATWCSRNFVQADYTDTYDGTGGFALILRNFPVSSISAVSIDGRIVSAAAGPLDSGYALSGRRLILRGSCFSRGQANVVVSYTAGYAPDAIPADLQMACLEWLGGVYGPKDRDPSVVLRKDGGSEERYAAPEQFPLSAPMPRSVYAVLSQYRDVVPA